MTPPPKMSSRPNAGRPTSGLGWLRAALGYTIPRQSLALFFDGLTAMLHAGQPLPDTLILASRYIDPELRSICTAIAPLLRNGAPLTSCLKPYSERFPNLVLPILEVGEVSGTLEGASRRIADTFNQGMAIDRKFKYGVYNPWLYILGLSMLSSVGLIFKATSNTTAVPFATEVAGVVLGTLITGVELSGCYLAWRVIGPYIFRWRRLRLLVDRIKLALPHMGTVFRNLSAARWARSFAVLWGAGVPVSQALEVSSRSALNAHYEDVMLKAARQTREGWTLHRSLSETELLPHYLISTIAAAETSGHMVELLERQATEMESEAFHRATMEMNNIVVIGQVILGLAVGVAAVTSGNPVPTPDPTLTGPN